MTMKILKLSTFLSVLAALGLTAPQWCSGSVTVQNAGNKPLTVQGVDTYSGWPYSGQNSNGVSIMTTTIQPGHNVDFGLYAEPAGLHQSISFSVNGYPLNSLSSSNTLVMNGPDQIGGYV